MTIGNHSKYCIIEIGQNTEKSPVDMRRLVVTQIPVKNHQLMVLWKTVKDNNNDNNNIQRLEDYIENHERGLIIAIRNDTDNTIEDRMTTTRKQKWEKNNSMAV